jgi:hypothetical protein
MCLHGMQFYNNGRGFAEAVAVFVVAVAILISLKPNDKRQPQTAGIGPDNTEWILTERSDFADNRAVGGLCPKWRKVGAPLARQPLNIVKFVGETQQ